MNRRQELLDALLVERYTNPWWTTPRPELDDSELTRARRRKALVEAWDVLDERKQA